MVEVGVGRVTGHLFQTQVLLLNSLEVSPLFLTELRIPAMNLHQMVDTRRVEGAQVSEQRH